MGAMPHNYMGAAIWDTPHTSVAGPHHMRTACVRAHLQSKAPAMGVTNCSEPHAPQGTLGGGHP